MRGRPRRRRGDSLILSVGCSFSNFLGQPPQSPAVCPPERTARGGGVGDAAEAGLAFVPTFRSRRARSTRWGARWKGGSVPRCEELSINRNGCANLGRIARRRSPGPNLGAAPTRAVLSRHIPQTSGRVPPTSGPPPGRRGRRRVASRGRTCPPRKEHPEAASPYPVRFPSDSIQGARPPPRCFSPTVCMRPCLGCPHQVSGQGGGHRGGGLSQGLL